MVLKSDEEEFSVLVEMTSNLLKSFYEERKVWLYIASSLGLDLTKYLFYKGLLKGEELRNKLSLKASEVHREVRLSFHAREEREEEILL